MILINPDYNRRQKLGGFSRYVPISVPIGIGYLAGYLRAKGKEVSIIDEEINPVTEGLLDKKIKDAGKPHIFGVSSLTAGIARSHELARMIKSKYPESVIILGNMHPTVMSEEVLKDVNVDIVVRGEGEEILDSLCERIKSRRSYDDVKGISFRKGERIVHNEAASLPDLNGIPSFPYDLFEQDSARYELGFVASSRGCPYSCIFCSQRAISGRRYRFFPVETVIQSLEELIDGHNKRFITFVDDSFLMNRQRVFELCESIRKMEFHEKATFDCQARGDTVDEEILRELRSSGFRTIHFGIETASERLMGLIDKKETVQEVIEGINLAKKCGFQVSGTFILGLPTETREERKAAYELAKGLSLDYVRFNNATPYPGTRLYEIAKEEGRLNAGSNYENLNACGTLVESPFRNSPLAYVPTTATANELRHDILKFNLLYSFRLRSILKILRERVGPAGWLALPDKWYLDAGEWIYLTKFGFRIFCLFLKVFSYKLMEPFKRKKIR